MKSILRLLVLAVALIGSAQAQFINPYIFRAAPNYSALSNVELIVDFTGLAVGTTNSYGIVDGSGNITTLKSLAPGPTGRDFTNTGTAPTLSAGSGVFDGAGVLRHGTASTWNFLGFNSTRANLKHTIHVICKIANSNNPGTPYGILGNTGTSGANKGFHVFYADANTTNNNAFVSAIANTLGTALVTLQSDCMVANRLFLLTIVTDLSQATAANRQKIYINDELILNAGVADVGAALQTGPTFSFEIGGCGNSTVPLVGSIREIVIQSAVESDVVRSAFANALMNKHGVSRVIDSSVPVKVFNPYNVYSDGRYPITNTLLRSTTNADVICSVYGDWTLGHSWRVTNAISMRRSTDGGRTWGSRTVLYTDATYGVIESGGGVDPDNGTLHFFFTAHSGTGTTIDSGFRFYHITSTDDGVTWSSVENLSSLVPSGIPFTYGGMIKNGAVLMKPYYTIDGPGDTNPNTLRLLRKDGAGAWTDVQVQANTTNYRNESSIIALDATRVLYIARDDITFEYHQFLSSDNGLNWSDQGALTLGYSFSFASPLRLKKIQISGVDVIIAYVADRANRRCQAIYAKSSSLIASGVSGWDLTTKTTVRQWITSPAQQPEYGDYLHDGTMNGIIAFALDDGTGGSSITSVIHIGSIPTWHYDAVKTALGL